MFFPDSNVLLYAFSTDQRGEQARALLEEAFVISVQSLNEFVHVMRRKFRRDWEQIELDVASVTAAAAMVRSLTPELQRDAVRLAKRYGLATYDAQIVASALDARCATLYSEDMQDGLVIDKRLTIRNPFV